MSTQCKCMIHKAHVDSWKKVFAPGPGVYYCILMSKTEAKRIETEMFATQATINGLRQAGADWSNPALIRLQERMAALYEKRWG